MRPPQVGTESLHDVEAGRAGRRATSWHCAAGGGDNGALANSRVTAAPHSGMTRLPRGGGFEPALPSVYEISPLSSRRIGGWRPAVDALEHGTRPRRGTAPRLIAHARCSCSVVYAGAIETATPNARRARRELIRARRPGGGRCSRTDWRISRDASRRDRQGRAQRRTSARHSSAARSPSHRASRAARPAGNAAARRRPCAPSCSAVGHAPTRPRQRAAMHAWTSPASRQRRRRRTSASGARRATMVSGCAVSRVVEAPGKPRRTQPRAASLEKLRASA